MIRNIATRLIVSSLVLVGFAFAVINNGGTDYSEALMPLTQGGTSNLYYVVMGTNLTVTCSGKSEVNSFTINGDNYLGSTNATVTPSADDRYYIVYSGKKSSGSFTVSGTNDWTTQTYSSVQVPFLQTGAGSYFYTTTDPFDSVVTANADFFLINNVEYTNTTVTTFPAKINDMYYFYFGATNASASMSLHEYTPELNVKLFLEGGLGQ